MVDFILRKGADLRCRVKGAVLSTSAGGSATMFPWEYTAVRANFMTTGFGRL
jgi:hypothetical protein